MGKPALSARGRGLISINWSCCDNEGETNVIREAWKI
jgi:hypothetical protein